MAPHDSAPTLPSLFRRFYNLVPLIEYFVIKDHRECYRRHWYESMKHDPGGLKSNILFMLEMEILLGSIFLGVMISVMIFAFADGTVAESFNNGEIGKPGFWIALTALYSCIVGAFFTIGCYVALMMVLPVSTQNIYTFLRSPSTNYLLLNLTRMCFTAIMSGVVLILLTLIQSLGNTWLATTVASIIFAVPMLFIIGSGGIVMNSAMYSGAWGARDITQGRSYQLSEEEAEGVMYFRAMKAKSEVEDEFNNNPTGFFDYINKSLLSNNNDEVNRIYTNIGQGGNTSHARRISRIHNHEGLSHIAGTIDKDDNAEDIVFGLSPSDPLSL